MLPIVSVAEALPGDVKDDEGGEREESHEPEGLYPERCAFLDGPIVGHVSIFYDTLCLCQATVSRTETRRYDCPEMPKLWTDTIEAHRHEVHDAIVETAAALVAKLGVRSVTMQQIAKETGIGRATLYKYFPDVETILSAWHERHVAAHLDHIARLQSQEGDAWKRLRAVLEFYALVQYEHHGTELAALLHRGEHVAHAKQHLGGLLKALLSECAKAGAVRKDVPAEELASYCLHALAAASSLRSKPAVLRLLSVTLAGLGP
jgi:AcrR family transcriptional regulator